MRTLFATVTRRESPQGTVYLARRDRPLKRVRDFRCEFVFRDRGRLIHAVSRPGVFSHREVDPGARQLMAAMEIAAGDRVLDIGCGSGTRVVGRGLSGRGRERHRRRFARSGRGMHRPGGEPQRARQYHGRAQRLRASCDPGSIDVVVANPPYYAGFRIARFFLGSRPRRLASRRPHFRRHQAARVVCRAHAAVVQRSGDRAVQGLLDSLHRRRS